MESVKQRILERLASGGTFNGKKPPTDSARVKNLKRVVARRDARIRQLKNVIETQKTQNQQSVESFAQYVAWVGQNCGQLLEWHAENANRVLRANEENLKLVEEIKLLRSQNLAGAPVSMNSTGTNTAPQSLPPISIFSHQYPSTR